MENDIYELRHIRADGTEITIKKEYEGANITEVAQLLRDYLNAVGFSEATIDKILNDYN